MHTKQLQSEYTCPRCHTLQKYTVYPWIDAKESPELTQRLIDGDLTAPECSVCGKRTIIRNWMVWHDPEKKTMIFLADRDDPSDITRHLKKIRKLPYIDESYAIRAVFEPREMIEKVTMLKYGFDDRLMELLKLMEYTGWRSRHPKTVTDHFGLIEVESDSLDLSQLPAPRDDGYQLLFNAHGTASFTAFDTAEYLAFDNPRVITLPPEEQGENLIVDMMWAVMHLFQAWHFGINEIVAWFGERIPAGVRKILEATGNNPGEDETKQIMKLMAVDMLKSIPAGNLSPYSLAFSTCAENQSPARLN